MDGQTGAQVTDKFRIRAQSAVVDAFTPHSFVPLHVVGEASESVGTAQVTERKLAMEYGLDQFNLWSGMMAQV